MGDYPPDSIGDKFQKFNQEIKSARSVSRDALYRLILLSAGIVGFSVSLFSIPVLQTTLKFEIVRYSWYAFLGVIILGFFILIFEGRINYGKSWKSFQSMNIPEKDDYSLKERFLASLVVLLTEIYPANLFFNRIYQSEKERMKRARINGLVVQYLAREEHNLIFLENLVFVLFILGLIFLVGSVV